LNKKNELENNFTYQQAPTKTEPKFYKIGIV